MVMICRPARDFIRLLLYFLLKIIIFPRPNKFKKSNLQTKYVNPKIRLKSRQIIKRVSRDLST